MKHFFTIIGTLLLICHAAQGFDTFARAEEFDAPQLDMTEQNYLAPAEERTWHPIAHTPLRATLAGIHGAWGNRAMVVLTTPKGRTIHANITDLSENDIEYVRNWYESNEFITIDGYFRGKFPARIISAIYNRNGTAIIALVAKADGKLQTLYVPNTEYTEEYAFTNKNWYTVSPSTLKLLREHADNTPQGDTPPLNIAENVNEAVCYAAVHHTSIVVLLLNRRGSSLDTAFRNYVKENPDAVKRWAKHYVFLIAYCREDGFYDEGIYDKIHDLNNLYKSTALIGPGPLQDYLGYIHGMILSLYETPPGAPMQRNGFSWSIYIPHMKSQPASRSIFHLPAAL